MFEINMARSNSLLHIRDMASKTPFLAGLQNKKFTINLLLLAKEQGIPINFADVDNGGNNAILLVCSMLTASYVLVYLLKRHIVDPLQLITIVNQLCIFSGKHLILQLILRRS